jgi:AbrB family looped-hinge helix DNA binding protein
MEHTISNRETSAVVTIAANGRLVIPAPMRAELGLVGGERLIVRVVDGALVMETVDAAVKRAQAILAPYIDGAPSLSEELIAERHAEAERE